LIFRFLVCLSLFAAAVVCGAVSYVVLRISEHKTYQNQYYAVTKQMKQSIEDFLEKYQNTADQLAVIANIKYPNSSSWPFVGIQDFNRLDTSVVRVTGSASANSILPIVATEQLAAFNSYAKEFLAGEEWISEYPQVYSLHNLGVWDTKDGIPYSIAHGQSFEGRDLIVPLLNAPTDTVKAGYVLGNVHAVQEIGIAMDDILSCTEKGYEECAILSNYLIGTEFGDVAETNIYHPVFSVDSGDGNSRVLGFTTVGFSWKQELQRLILDEDVSGLNVVLSSIEQPAHTVSRTYTFTYKDGDVFYSGEGDQHDRAYSSMAVDVPLSLTAQTDTSFQYLLTIHPTSEYEKQFQSDTPLLTALGFSTMIVFASIIFLLYDYFMNQNAKWKDQVLSMKRDFVRFVSHEVRTPLNTVSVGLQLIYEGLLVQEVGEAVNLEEILELTIDVQSSTTTAVSVLNDLLNFDKLQSGELQIAREPLRIWETVATAMRSFKIPATQKKISVDLLFENFVNEEISCKDLVVIGDKFKISHIIRNLMSNALKFTDLGGSIVVTLRWTTVDDEEVCTATDPSRRYHKRIQPAENVSCTKSQVTISIADSGYGLSAEQIGMLFKDGVQFNPNKLQAGQGSGLGLYLSQAIALLHSGKMWATSEGEGKGSTFCVQFPVEASVTTSTPPVADMPSSRSEKSKLMILVVDDAASNRKIVCRMLTKRGFECEEAKDGREAINIIDEKDDPDYFSCVLMDFEMPVLNGPDATAALRAKGYRFLICGLTGNVMPDDIDHFRSCGADHVLSKPFQITEFDTYMMAARV
ncbi:unnamed protein product, partial [Ectocarpus fasciculatus]